MGNIGLPELLIVLVIALVVFGPKRLPQMGRQLGTAIREFRTATTDIRSQIGIDDITDSVRDIKSGLSLTGDGKPADQPAAATGPQSVAPAAVTAAVTAAATAPAAATVVDPATGVAEAVSLAPDATGVADAVSLAPDALDEPVTAEPTAVADPVTPSMPDAPTMPEAPDAPFAPDTQAAAAPAPSDGAGVETFGKLRRSTAPASTVAD